MSKTICVNFFLFLSFSMVYSQSAAVNTTLSAIGTFETSTLQTLIRPFNSLRDDVYGHFYRSQNTLRIARQSLFSTASTFPFYALSDETRQNLVNRLTAILTIIIDPTVDFLQKDSMLRYFNFMANSMSPIESAVAVVKSNLLKELKDAVANTNDDACLLKENITAGKLTKSFDSVISAVNDCTRDTSAQYRAPINEFTRVHFIALPFINRITNELSQCSNGNNKEDCITKFLSKYCEDESCKVSEIISVVATQASTMVNTNQMNFEECLSKIESKLPAEIPFLENVKKCVKVSNEI